MTNYINDFHSIFYLVYLNEQFLYNFQNIINKNNRVY